MTKNKVELKKVTVIRYARNHEWLRRNLGGAAFIFDMDYEKRTVDVSVSLCNKKDNFSKKLAQEKAREGGVVRTLPLNNFQKIADERGGFVDGYLAIIGALHTADQIQLVDALDSREKLLLKKCSFDRDFDMTLEYR